MATGRGDLRQKHVAAVCQGGSGKHEPAEPAGGAVLSGLCGAVRHLLEKAAHHDQNRPAARYDFRCGLFRRHDLRDLRPDQNSRLHRVVSGEYGHRHRAAV